MTLLFHFNNFCTLADLPPLIQSICEIPDIDALLKGKRLNPFAFRLMLYEAMTNAIVHGNKSDPQKKISFTLEFDKNQLCGRLIDEGNGFDFAAHPDHFPNAKACSGRGILLMGSYGYHIQYEGIGNILSFSKTLDPINE